MKGVLALALIALACSGAYAGRISRLEPNKAPTCDFSACKLPDCLCSDINPPTTANPIPQMVFLTFDDGITTSNKDFYDELFAGRTNPNGQPISGTFFVTHEYNDYSLTHQRWREGHEIALHTITHTSNTTYWATLNKEGWLREVADQRDQLAHFAKIPKGDLQGFRAPFLQGGGDVMYAALKEGGLTYESSRPTRLLRPVLWPYTADYESLQDCQIAPCPIESHPGFWVSPLVDLIGSNGYPCAFVDTCLDQPTTVQETFDLLYNNFLDHYSGGRAPYGVYTHAAWVLQADRPWIKEGYLKFVDEIQKNKDVFIVSISKALDWVRNPVDLTDMELLPESWKPKTTPPNQCTFVINCEFTNDFLPPELQPGTRYMSSCQLCPPKYPWKGNPLGRN